MVWVTFRQGRPARNATRGLATTLDGTVAATRPKNGLAIKAATAPLLSLPALPLPLPASPLVAPFPVPAPALPPGAPVPEVLELPPSHCPLRFPPMRPPRHQHLQRWHCRRRHGHQKRRRWLRRSHPHGRLSYHYRDRRCRLHPRLLPHHRLHRHSRLWQRPNQGRRFWRLAATPKSTAGRQPRSLMSESGPCRFSGVRRARSL
jgi:hypothetical protein